MVLSVNWSWVGGPRGEGRGGWSVNSKDGQSCPRTFQTALPLCVSLCRGTEHKTKPDGIHRSQTHMLIRSLEISRKFHTLFGSWMLADLTSTVGGGWSSFKHLSRQQHLDSQETPSQRSGFAWGVTLLTIRFTSVQINSESGVRTKGCLQKSLGSTDERGCLSAERYH